MRSFSQRVSMYLLAILLCAGLSVAADFEAAKRAYQQKDYATALKEATP
jgi:hypothetical protein